MIRKKKLIMFGSVAAILAIGVTINLRREKPIFSHTGIVPTLNHWYYAKHLHAFRCEDDLQAQAATGADRFRCASCPVGPPDRVVNLPSQIEPPVFQPGPTRACSAINTLILETNWDPCDPDQGGPIPCRVRWQAPKKTPNLIGPGEVIVPMIICQRKPWDGFVRIDGEKISCATVESVPSPK